ncbi:MAG TPA: hypothetical protein VFZ78_04390 [Flavisolibacter sp.]
MKLLLLTFSLLLTLAMEAQDSWTVSYRGKTVLSATGENEARNTVLISRAGIGKSSIVLTYRQAKPQKGWVRIMNVYSPKDEELYEIQAPLIAVTATQLRKWASKYNTVKIYSWYVPVDPELKARVRVRRVHLCTIRFQ